MSAVILCERSMLQSERDILYGVRSILLSERHDAMLIRDRFASLVAERLLRWQDQDVDDK